MTTEEMLDALAAGAAMRKLGYIRDGKNNVYSIEGNQWSKVSDQEAVLLRNMGVIEGSVRMFYRTLIIANRIDDRRFKRELKKVMIPAIYKENIAKGTIYYIYKEQAETMRSRDIHNYIVYAHQTKSGKDEYIPLAKFFGEYEHKYEGE